MGSTLVAMGALLWAMRPAGAQSPTTTAGTDANHSVGTARVLSNAFAEIAEHAIPSVVSIRMRGHEDVGPIETPFFIVPGGREELRGLGSGVVIREDGVIITNSHVVEHADDLVVHLHDGRRLRARVLGSDPATDVAVIKIDAHGLPVMPWADSERTRVGEWVLAIGAPLGLEASVTHGVVSAKGRAGLGANQIEDFLQTDASVNPGSSGGPLVDMDGRVVGITSMVARAHGVGFAVPSALARRVAELIIAHGRVPRSWIGIGVKSSDGPGSEVQSPARRGAVIRALVHGGPADAAGLRVGDTVVEVAGRPVQSGTDLLRAVIDQSPGTNLQLTVLRSARPVVISVHTLDQLSSPR